MLVIILSEILIACGFCSNYPESEYTSKRIEQSIETDINQHRTLLTLKDTLNKQILFYLLINNIVTDSTKIININCSFDSLAQINDTVWHYIYSYVYNSDFPDSYYYKQLIIEELNGKIHFSFIDVYLSGNIDFKDKNNNIYYKQSGYYSRLIHNLNITDTMLGPHILVTHKYVDSYLDNSSGIDSVFADSTCRIILLKYDGKKKVYYNMIDTLEDGIYLYEINKPMQGKKRTDTDYNLDDDFKEVHISRTEVFALITRDFGGYGNYYVYYKNQWFSVSSKKLSFEDHQMGYLRGIKPFLQSDDW